MPRPNRPANPSDDTDETAAPAPIAETLQDQIDAHEHRVDNIDRDAIDQIILNEDVLKGGKLRVERKDRWTPNICG